MQSTACQGFLVRLEQWRDVNLANPEVPLPEAVAHQARGSKEDPTLHGPFRVPLRALVAWLRHRVAVAGEEAVLVLLPAGTRRDGVAGRRGVLAGP